MATIFCNDDTEIMILIDEDSRQEWYEATYQCPVCDSIKIHRQEFDQNGLILSETLEGR